jgi:hypothetical protein
MFVAQMIDGCASSLLRALMASAVVFHHFLPTLCSQYLLESYVDVRRRDFQVLAKLVSLGFIIRHWTVSAGVITYGPCLLSVWMYAFC